MLILLLIVSGFTWIQYNDLQNKNTSLKTKDAEIESLNQRVLQLSTFENLINLLKPPSNNYGSYRSGVQLVSSYPMFFNYNYPDTYDDSKTITVLYIPGNGSTVSIDLFIDSVAKYPMNLTLQRGNAWRNETWEKTGSTSMVWDNVTWSWEFWQAPVVWSSNVTETGIYHTSPLESGWYTLSMFGPLKATKEVGNSAAQVGTPISYFYLHESAKIDSYRVLVTVTVPNESLRGFFLASSDWYR
jgi:hypothetical protein